MPNARYLLLVWVNFCILLIFCHAHSTFFTISSQTTLSYLVAGKKNATLIHWSGTTIAQWLYPPSVFGAKEIRKKYISYILLDEKLVWYDKIGFLIISSLVPDYRSDIDILFCRKRPFFTLFITLDIIHGQVLKICQNVCFAIFVHS